MPSLLVPTATHIPINFSKRQSLNLPQFQLYAVEKWLVDRSRQSSLLLVFTGDPNHTVSLDELVTDDDAAWDAAIHAYRRDGAKPKQTQNGVLMVTSLAHFRSDWTIVNIPSGDFATARDQLYANINLLRMGCTGRSALSLGEPSDTTKDRFISLYHLPETSFSPPATGEHPLPPSSSKRFPTVRGKTKDSHTFIPAVLELVKLIQAGLSIFGYYTSPIDGLLCDSTLDAINHWMAEIGEPLLGLEPTERVVDPMFVSALLSLVLAVRNKLATLITLDFSSHQSAASNNTNVTPSPPPKDPFLFPQPFILSLSVYLQATTGTSGSTALTPQIIEAIDAAHESATRRRLKPVRKVLRTKIDDHPHAKVDSEGDEKKEPRERDFYHYNYRSGGEEPSSLPPSTVTSPTTGPSSGRLLALTSLTPSSSTSLAHAGLSSLTTTTSDLASFLTVALTKEKDGDRLGSGPTFTGLHVRAHAQGRRERRRRMGASVSVIPDAPSGSLRSKTRESVDLGHFYHAASGDPSSSTEGITNTRLLDTVVAGSVKALWSGRVAELVRLRELANSPSAQWQDPPALLTPSLSLRVPSGGSALSASSSWSKARSKGKSKTSLNQASVSNVNVHSDGDVNTSKDGNLKSETDDDSEGLYAPNASQTTFGSLLGGKVKGKLGTWTAMAKRRARGEGGSVDLTSTGIPQSVRSAPCSVGVSPAVSQDGSGGGSASGAPQVPTVIEDDEGDESRMSKGQIKHLNLPGPRKPKPSRIATAPSAISGRNRSGSIAGVLTIGGSANASSGPQSPTLPPMVYAPGEPPEDEGELLSSGQISPLSDYRPSPFNLLHGGGSASLSVPMGQSLTGSTSNLLPSSATAIQETASKLHSKLLTVTHQQRQGHERSVLGAAKDKRPPVGVRRLTAPSSLPRITSWSDPMSARNMVPLTLGHSESDSDDVAEEDIEEEDEEGAPGYEGLEGYAEIESDEPNAALSRIARPFVKSNVSLPTASNRKRRPTLKRRNLTSSILGAGSDGELIPSRAGVREKTRFHSLLSVVDGDGSFNEEPMAFDEMAYYEFSGDEGEVDKWMRRQRSLRRRGYLHGLAVATNGHPRLIRRRSFHDLDDLCDISVLAPERMRIDVEICGQVLVMLRREEHLKNVIACLKILNTNLSDTNALLRQDYEINMPTLSTVEARTKVLAALDTQDTHADKLSQSTNILRYEAEQFRVPDLWHAASLSRQKVFSLRQKVFGENGSRRLPSGAHGAHGRFNRLQKTIEGDERLVDHLGRTEDEAEEEQALVEHESLTDGNKRQRLIDVDLVQRSDIAAVSDRMAREDEALGVHPGEETEDEEDAVEHSSIRPVWLLKFFVGWGARWSARAATNNAATTSPMPNRSTVIEGGEPKSPSPDDVGGVSTAVEPLRQVRRKSTPSIIISDVDVDTEDPKKVR